MWTAESLKQALQPAIADPAAAKLLETLAPTLARVLNREVKPDDVKAEFADALPLFQALQGATVKREGTQLDFHDATIGGDLNLQNVAGRDITTINIGGVAFTVGDVTDYWDTEVALVGRMEGVNDATIRAIAGKALGIDPMAGGIDPLHTIARALMRTDFPRLVDFVGQLANSHCQAAGEVVGIAGPFCWINRDAAATIPKVSARPPGQRGIGINAVFPQTASQYVGCAPISPQSYEVIQVSGRNSDDIATEWTADIVDAAAQRLGCPPEEVDANLAFVTLYVVLPGEPPDDDLLGKLRTRFPTVTFLVLTGDRTKQAFDDLHLSFVEFLTPELKPGDETGAMDQIHKAMILARCKKPN